MEKYLIKSANEEHCKKIWEWRNDKVTRAMFINSDFIDWKQHQAWYKEVMDDSNQYLYVGYLKSELIGVSKFDFFNTAKKHYKISINIDPMKRGLGIGKIFLRKSIKTFWEEVPEANSIVAEIKKENLASINTFENNNFKLEKKFSKIYRYRLYRFKNNLG